MSDGAKASGAGRSEKRLLPRPQRRLDSGGSVWRGPLGALTAILLALAAVGYAAQQAGALTGVWLWWTVMFAGPLTIAMCWEAWS